jgi:hypothetical protein
MQYKKVAYDAVLARLNTGLSDYRIAAETGVARATVRRWRLAAVPPRTILHVERGEAWKVSDGLAYCYLLGAYLGDGTVVANGPNSASLRIVNDVRYPGISEEICEAMARTFPGSPTRTNPSSNRGAEVLCISHPGVMRAFPQHGPGRKHLRPIELTEWQRALTHAHPEALIRGLIHSDGCRSENRFQTRLPSGRVATYQYVRYFFSNLSDDIRAIFASHCEQLGIRVTQSNPRNLSVSHRASVAILERIVGPKR